MIDMMIVLIEGGERVGQIVGERRVSVQMYSHGPSL